MPDRPALLITGGEGQLAHALAERLRASYHVLALSRTQLDVSNSQAVARLVSDLRPAVVLNTAALTDVDACEQNREQALAVNAQGAGNVARASAHCGARLVHFSTDFVFDGESDRPYMETDRPNPHTIYGQSKLEGELLVAEALPQALIVRVAWLYSARGRNFVTSIVRQIREEQKKVLRVVDDQCGSPTSTELVAKQIENILRQKLSGIVHMATFPAVSRYDFARALVQDLGLDVEVEPISSSELKTKTPRPLQSALENCRLNELQLSVMTDWHTCLKDFVAQHRKDLS